MTTDDNKLAEDFFDKVKPKIATGAFVVDPEKILKSPEWDQAFMVFFCTGCGTYTDITKSLAEKMAKMAAVDLPEDPTGYYFELKSCRVCQGPKGADAIALKQVPKN
ncbi:MAG: hypothetical protein V1684_02495 [bacterium]